MLQHLHTGSYFKHLKAAWVRSTFAPRDFASATMHARTQRCGRLRVGSGVAWVAQRPLCMVRQQHLLRTGGKCCFLHCWVARSPARLLVSLGWQPAIGNAHRLLFATQLASWTLSLPMLSVAIDSSHAPAWCSIRWSSADRGVACQLPRSIRSPDCHGAPGDSTMAERTAGCPAQATAHVNHGLAQRSNKPVFMQNAIAWVDHPLSHVDLPVARVPVPHK
jgi:hypothetical protein